jgi:hypothetical protein
MSDAYVIETGSHTAGLAIRERDGFRFYAADVRFDAIDNRLFAGLDALRLAVRAATPSDADRRRKAG